MTDENTKVVKKIDGLIFGGRDAPAPVSDVGDTRHRRRVRVIRKTPSTN